MKIMVTGGAGFIGSHITDALIAKGHRVVIVDNLVTGSERNLNPEATFYKVGIESADLENVFAKEHPDMVTHQAAHTVVTESVRNPVYDAMVNILGSINVLDNCLKFGVKKVVYASSCALYGNPQYLPLDEKHPVGATAPYGISKHTVEHYLQVYNFLYGLKYTALRYANVYGPRQNPYGEAGVVAIFAKKMLAGEEPTIFGSGDKTRAYVYVGDIVKANLLALDSDCQGIYNIGTRQETSDQEIFDTMREEFHYTGLARYDNERPGEIKHMCMDCTLARAELGWRPEVALRDGIKKAAEFYKSELKSVGV